MANNIEVKAILSNEKEVEEILVKWTAQQPQILDQLDTFYHVPQGRLKLRQESSDAATLIYYNRPDQKGPKQSTYLCVNTKDTEHLKQVLNAVLGKRGEVKKTRKLFLIGQTRVHLDNVEGLGHFLELEVVLEEHQTAAEGQAIAEELMKKLRISSANLIDNAYMDMLEDSRSQQ